MTMLKSIANATVTAVALAPLAPVIGLMWAAKGIHSLMKKSAVVQEQKPAVVPKWVLETVNYCSVA